MMMMNLFDEMANDRDTGLQGGCCHEQEYISTPRKFAIAASLYKAITICFQETRVASSCMHIDIRHVERAHPNLENESARPSASEFGFSMRFLTAEIQKLVSANVCFPTTLYYYYYFLYYVVVCRRTTCTQTSLGLHSTLLLLVAIHCTASFSPFPHYYTQPASLHPWTTLSTLLQEPLMPASTTTSLQEPLVPTTSTTTTTSLA
jgi:hypothetical protein